MCFKKDSCFVNCIKSIRGKIFKSFLKDIFWIYLSLFLLGIVFLLAGESLQNKLSAGKELAAEVLIYLGQSFALGAFITFVFDLALMKKHFRKTIIDIIGSDEYMKNLTDDELEKNRKNITRNLLIKRGGSKNEDLVKLDNDIFRQLVNPYFELYSIDVNCQKCLKPTNVQIGDDNENSYYIKKLIQRRFVIINPLKNECHFNVPDILKSAKFDVIQGFKEEDKYAEVKNFFYYVDEERVRQSLDIEVVQEDIFSEPNEIFKKRVTYNRLKVNNDEPDSKKFDITFQNKLIIEVHEERCVPISDTSYTFRSERPIQSLNVHYRYDDPEHMVIGNCFGSLTGTMTQGIRISPNKDEIKITSSGWLLPGNGFFVTVVPKKENSLTNDS